MLLVPSTRGCFLVQELGGTPFELVLSLVSKGDGWKCRLPFRFSSKSHSLASDARWAVCGVLWDGALTASN